MAEPAPEVLLVLSKLVSLGAGLIGCSLSACEPDGIRFRGWLDTSPGVGIWAVDSDSVVASRFFVEMCFDLPRLVSGSRVMTLGFGGLSVAMSISSVRLTLQSHISLGDIVVGLVSVEVIMYETVPRSN
jgi:hypothetical protein